MSYGSDTPYDDTSSSRRRRTRSTVLLCFVSGVGLGSTGLAGAWALGAFPTMTPRAIITSAQIMSSSVWEQQPDARTFAAARNADVERLNPIAAAWEDAPLASSPTRESGMTPVVRSLAPLAALPSPEHVDRRRVDIAYAPTSAMAQADPTSPLFDSRYSLGPMPDAFGQHAPLASNFSPMPGSRVVVATAPVQLPADVDDDDAGDAVASMVPLPVPRPSDLRPQPQMLQPQPQPPSQTAQTPIPLQPRMMARPPRQTRMAAAPAAPTPAPAQPTGRGFFQRLFGTSQEQQAQPRGPVLAYASPGDEAGSNSSLGLGRLLPSSPVTSGGGTAVYDIAARTVTLPSGEKLEAHSGLGDKMDDPRHVHVKMRGATPPHTYDLSLREKLFHGVQAIRLTPVGGEGAVYNRVGLLAHTYMLGPSGQSNGCVSFRDYNKFLAAFQRGEIRRLVVVARSS